MKLNIACGKMLLNDYTNYDLLPFTDKNGKTTDILGDIRNLINHFTPDSVDEILAYHCLEHLIISDVIHVLNQCYTILKEGGKLLIECPDMIKSFDYYIIKRNNPKGYAHCMMGGDSVKYGETWAHKSMWSGEMMAEQIKLKFKNVVIGDGLSHNCARRDFRVTGEK